MINVTYGKGTTKFGPGIQIDLTGVDVANAIFAYLVAHDINIFGPATINVNGELIKKGSVYVDPSGEVIAKGIKYNGRGTFEPVDELKYEESYYSLRSSGMMYEVMPLMTGSWEIDKARFIKEVIDKGIKL